MTYSDASNVEIWNLKNKNNKKTTTKWLIFNHLRIHLTSFHRLVQHPWHLRRVPGWHSLLCSGARKYAKCPKQELLHSRYHASSNCFLWERGWKFTGNKNKKREQTIDIPWSWKDLMWLLWISTVWWVSVDYSWIVLLCILGRRPVYLICVCLCVQAECCVFW